MLGTGRGCLSSLLAKGKTSRRQPSFPVWRPDERMLPAGCRGAQVPRSLWASPRPGTPVSGGRAGPPRGVTREGCSWRKRERRLPGGLRRHLEAGCAGARLVPKLLNKGLRVCASLGQEQAHRVPATSTPCVGEETDALAGDGAPQPGSCLVAARCCLGLDKDHMLHPDLVPSPLLPDGHRDPAYPGVARGSGAHGVT